MRRLFLLFVVLVATTALWAHDFEVNGIYYNYLDETSVEVTYKGSNYAVYSNEYSGELAIPEIVTYNSLTYSVTSIGEEAFRACSSLNSVTISNNVTSIGKSAFNSCSSLISFTIPSNIVHIGESAFENCTNLTSIVIPNSITSIENYTFKSCSSLKDITIPSTVTTIGVQALAFTLWEVQQPDGIVYINDVLYEYKGDMKRNTSLEVKPGTISISPHAFFGGSNLVAITIPNSVKSIGKWAFKDCSDLTSIVIPEGITHIEEEILSLCFSLESVSIPEGVKSIGNNAFYACHALKTITIPNTIEHVGNNAFHYCDNLTDIHVKAVNVPNLGTIVFSSQPTCHIPCGTLAAYQSSQWANIVSNFVEECEAVVPDSTHCIFYTSTDGNIVEPRETDVFGANIVTNTYENGQGTITFDGPVTSIGERAFSQCKTLTTIILPTSVNNIGMQAFMFCEELKEISIPENVTTIGEGAFHFCQALTSVELSKNLNIIEKSAFQVCTALTSISVPDSVTFIGNRAFCNCQSLSLVTIGSGMTMIDEAAFMASPVANLHMKSVIPPTFIADSYPLFDSSPTCYIPCGTLEAYEASDWAEQVGEFVEECEELPDSTHYIYYTSSTGKIITPYKTDVFGANIISNIYENGQGVITFDGPVTTIGDSAFLQCEKLNTITLPNSVTSIGNRTFKDCTLLHSIIIPNSVMSIGEYAFQFCIYLSSINLPNRMHNIGNGAFRYCSSLSTIIIPDGIDAIADAVFDGCYLLSSITIPNGVKTIGVQAFRYCESLSEFIMGDGVTTIGNEAFYGCDALSSITIPKSVISIGEHVLNYCTSLTAIAVEKSNSVFDSREDCNAIIETNDNILRYGCSSTIIPNTITEISEDAFRGSSIVSIEIPSSVIKIEMNPFMDCSFLNEIMVDANNVVYDSRNGCNAIIKTHSNSLITGCRSTNIPKSVTSISSEAFLGIDSLMSIVIPDSVKSIGYSAFGYCYSLQSVIVGSSVKYIRQGAFNECKSLAVINIPKSVKTIESGAFSGCSSLETVKVEATTPPTLETYSIFVSSPICYIPCGTLAAYQASKWAKQVGEFVEECEAEQYTRDVTPNRYGTICLPFGSTDFSGATFYEIAYKAPFMIYFDEVTKLEAGKPYIFYAHSNKLIVTSDGSRVDNPLFDNGLYGTFDEIVAAAINILTNNYIVNNNTLCLCGEYCSLSANRAYVKLDEVSSTARALSPGRKRVSMSVQGENTTTALDNISEETESITIKEGVYDILGRKMSQPVGMGFYIIDGQKVIISQ